MMVIQPPIRDEILQILRQHHAEIAAYGVSSIALFGSVARNEATTKSDVDLLVEFDRPIGLFEFIRVKIYLEKILGIEVSLVEREAVRKELRDKVFSEALYA